MAGSPRGRRAGACYPEPGGGPVRLLAYLDNAATTPALPEVAQAMLGVLGAEEPAPAGAFANPSAVHRWGLAAAAAVAEARRAVAAMLGAAEDELIFTSGGTEANHLALLGLCRARRRRGRHLLTTAIEHRSVLAACDALAAEGWAVTRLPVSPQGLVSPEAVAAAVRPDTVLCSLAHVNNEIGAVQPVEAIAAALRRASGGAAALHVDGVQALGKLPTPYAAWGVDLASLSAHKIGGPKGSGALYVRRGVRLAPAVAGEQEAGLRPGTENVPGLVGFGAAARAAASAPPGARLRAQKLRFGAGLRARLPGLCANGPDPEDAAPHILNLCFCAVAPGVPAEVLLHALEAEGVACSAGSACSARHHEPSHVLAALGLAPERLAGSLRFSLGPRTSDAELDLALEAIPAALRRLADAIR